MLNTPAPSMRVAPGEPGGINRVQVGCGPKHLRDGWWNTDLRKFPGIDEALDATAPWRWRDQLDYVYGEHFLEHLPLEGAIAFLVHAGNALRPGGSIRLSTPGLEWVLRTHYDLKGNDPAKQVMSTYGMNRAFHGWGHHFLYSRDFLEWAMRNVGYEDVRFFNYGESDRDDLRGLEMHGKSSVVDGFPSVWVVEGTRPASPMAASDELAQSIEQNFVRYVRSGH